MLREKTLLNDHHVTRRSFIKVSAILAGTMGLAPSFIPDICKALESPLKPPVIWLHFQECTGCTETLLRTEGPDVASLILDLISLEYHETLFAAAGHQIEDQLHEAITKYSGKYITVVEGAIPQKENGRFCMIAGKTAEEILKEVSAETAAIIAIGSCAAWGGIPSSGPNPTGSVGVRDIITDKPVISIPGCPPSPYNFLATVAHYLTFNTLPELDDQGRPKFAYGRLIHDQCERRGHFDSGRFAFEFGDEGHRKGYCLYPLGCKGPRTYGSCPEVGFNREKTWPVSVGHPCFGCIEQGIGFHVPLFENPPKDYADPPEERGMETSSAAVAVGALVGGAVTAAVMKTMELPNKENKES